VAVIGSSGLLEIALNGGSAARRFGLKIGDKVTVRMKA
jgi:S-adenosylmethionine hydrolase